MIYTRQQIIHQIKRINFNIRTINFELIKTDYKKKSQMVNNQIHDSYESPKERKKERKKSI